MKFDYEGKKTEEREVVAVVWASHVVVKGDDGEGIVLCSNQAASSYAFVGKDFEFYLNDSSTKKKFYKGDKITITF